MGVLLCNEQPESPEAGGEEGWSGEGHCQGHLEGGLRAPGVQAPPHLGILGRLGVNIHSGQVIRGFSARVPVNAGQVDKLLPGSWRVESRQWG